MTLRAPVPGPGRGVWRLGPQAVDENPEFTARVLQMWDEGLNTKEIADIVFQWEYVVERCVRLGRERRRTEK
jgi:hypothetical protein